MVCYAVQQSLLQSAEGNSGSHPYCVATSADSFIGNVFMANGKHRDIVTYRQRIKGKRKRIAYPPKEAAKALRVLTQENCDICGAEEPRLKHRLCVDHDHKTRKVRGILCSTCNRVLGLVKENVTILNRMAAYLE